MSGDTIKQISSYRVWFKTIPSDDVLTTRGFKKINQYVNHNHLTQRLESTTPFVDGDFVTTVKVVNLTSDEIARNKATSMSKIRSQRNEMLKDTDWAAIRKAETGTAMSSAMATYRQALRDVPATIGSADPRTWNNWPSISLDGSSASGV